MQPFAQIEREWNGHLLRITVAEVDGHQEVVGLELWGITPPSEPQWTTWQRSLPTSKPIRTTTLRIPLRGIVDECLATLATRWAPLAARNHVGKAFLAGIGYAGPRRGRRRSYDAAHWGEVAEVAAGGGSRAVAERWMIAPSTAERWVAFSRQGGRH